MKDIDWNNLLICPHELIEEHWEYVGGILRVHAEGDQYDKIKFHYETAFRHGWKHAVEKVREEIS